MPGRADAVSVGARLRLSSGNTAAAAGTGGDGDGWTRPPHTAKLDRPERTAPRDVTPTHRLSDVIGMCDVTYVWACNDVMSDV